MSIQTTRWSLVARAADHAAPDSADALAALCTAWRPAVLRYFRHRRARDEAEDLTQGFFLHVIDHALVARADPVRGRFRTFLYAALANWNSDQQRRERAQRRGGIALHVAGDGEGASIDNEDPAAWFDRCWAECLLERALRALADEARRQGRSALFDAARPFLVEPPEPHEYAAAAERMGLRPNTFAVAVGRLRKRLQALVRREVVDTTSSPEEAGDELRRLRGAWGRE